MLCACIWFIYPYFQPLRMFSRFFTLFACLFLAQVIPAQTPNRVLQLSGNGYVELPVHAFSDLTEATIEGWVKWDAFRLWARVFDFGARWNGLSLASWESTPTLIYQIMAPDRVQHPMPIDLQIETNRWYH